MFLGPHLHRREGRVGSDRTHVPHRPTTGRGAAVRAQLASRAEAEAAAQPRSAVWAEARTGTREKQGLQLREWMNE